MKKLIKNNKAFTVYIIISLVILITAIITAPGNELLYMILAQYIILPVAGLICSACCVKKGTVAGFISPVIFVAVASLLPFAVFKKTDIVFLVFSLVPCLAGALAGIFALVVSKLRKKNKEEKNNLRLEKEQDIEQAKNEEEDFSVENDDSNVSESNANDTQDDIPEIEE